MLNMKFVSQQTRDNLHINVVNKKDHIPTEFDYYIGRPSPLSNPYTHLNNSKHAKMVVGTRAEAINAYSAYFKLNMDSIEFQAEINNILEIYNEHGAINFVCYCFPKSCHGDYIKKYIEDIILDI